MFNHRNATGAATQHSWPDERRGGSPQEERAKPWREPRARALESPPGLGCGLLLAEIDPPLAGATGHGMSGSIVDTATVVEGPAGEATETHRRV